MRRIHRWLRATLLVAAAVTFAASTAVGLEADDGQGFATPEEAVVAYMAGVAEADMGRILATVAIDEASAGMDFAAQIDRTQFFGLATIGAPAEYQLFVDVNRAAHTNRVALQVRNLAYGLLSGEVGDSADMLLDVDQEWAESFITSVDPSGLAAISLLDVGVPMPELIESPEFERHSVERANNLGGDEWTERVALYSLGDQLFYSGLSLIRYGDAWKVYDQTSALTGTDPAGFPKATTQAEYDDLTAEG